MSMNYDTKNLIEKYMTLQRAIRLYEKTIVGRKEVFKVLERAYMKYVSVKLSYKINPYSEYAYFITDLLDELDKEALKIINRNKMCIDVCRNNLVFALSLANNLVEKYIKLECHLTTVSSFGDDEQLVSVFGKKPEIYNYKNGVLNSLGKSKTSYFVLTPLEHVKTVLSKHALDVLDTGDDYALLGKLKDDDLGNIVRRMLEFINDNGPDLENIPLEGLTRYINNKKFIKDINS